METLQQMHNPFTPVFGKIPPVLAGRTDIIELIVEALKTDVSSPELCSIISGVRGSGKTTLLQYLKFRAEELGWVVASVTATAGMLDDIIERINDEFAHLVNTPNKRKLTSVQISNLGLSWENNSKQKMNFRSQITEISKELSKTDTGILFLVDEIDGELDEMAQLATVFQHLIGENRKVALFMAGLPFHVSSLLTGKTTSFLRRAAQFRLENLEDYEIEEAFDLTITEGGKSITEEALSLALRTISGFPFMMQLVGYRTWVASGKSVVIYESHVAKGSKIAREELKTRIFGATLSELTKGDIEFLKTLNRDGNATSRREIQKTTNRTSSWISKYKRRLLSSGVIKENFTGDIQFALPGFAEYLTENGL